MMRSRQSHGRMDHLSGAAMTALPVLHTSSVKVDVGSTTMGGTRYMYSSSKGRGWMVGVGNSNEILDALVQAASPGATLT